MANYLAATILEQQDAEAAYQALVQGNFNSAQVQLFGQSHQMPTEECCYDPNKNSERQIKQMMTWLIPFGFFAGFTFNRITDLTILAIGSPAINGFLGGLLGAASGLLGSIFIGGGTKVFYKNPDELTYQKRVALGKYILLISGTEVQLRQANRELRSRPYESIQIYEGPAPSKPH